MSDRRANAGPFTLVLPPNGRATLFEADGSGVVRECPWGVGHFEALTHFAGEVIRLHAMIEEMTLGRERLRLWLEFIQHNCTSPEAREYAGEAMNGAHVPEGYDWDERSGR
ncbi:MAG TPA: hypothetical protein VGM38_09425 [Pseudolysinimonas sp.]|jgi:hypothetical protein